MVKMCYCKLLQLPLAPALLGLGWVGGGLRVLNQRSASRNCSLAPNHQFTHSDFTSGGVIPEKSIPPQPRVYRQVHTDWSDPYSIFITGARDEAPMTSIFEFNPQEPRESA